MTAWNLEGGLQLGEKGRVPLDVRGQLLRGRTFGRGGRRTRRLPTTRAWNVHRWPVRSGAFLAQPLLKLSGLSRIAENLGSDVITVVRTANNVGGGAALSDPTIQPPFHSSRGGHGS